MIKTLVLYDKEQIGQVLQFEVFIKDLDLNQAIHDAALEYGKTLLGWNDICNGEFDLNTFFKCVPNMICRKYEFVKSGIWTVDGSLRSNKTLLTAKEIAACKDYCQTEENRAYGVNEAAVCFARMWGVMETLGELPEKDFRELSKLLVAWAEEFVRNDEKDLIAFFRCKTENRT